MSNVKGKISIKKALIGNLYSNNSISSTISQRDNLIGTINYAEKMYVRELHFANYYEFPTFGESDCLYISEDENAIYRFDATNRIYLCVGRDYNKIDIIQSTL